MSKLVFPQDVYDTGSGTKLRREGGLSFRDLAAIEIAAQMSGAITFSALDDNKKAKNLAAIPTIAVDIAERLEASIEEIDRLRAEAEKPAPKSPLILIPRGDKEVKE